MSKSLDRLTLLASFVRIAERGSISAAARDLGFSQASVSRHLGELETRLETRLIERTTHSLALTDAGEAALLEARQLLQGWGALAERFKDQDQLSGTLQVIAPVALGQLHLIDAALDWQVKHPDVRLNWRLDDAEINLVQSGYDLWVRIGRPKDDRLIVRELVQVERLVVAAPELARSLVTPHPDALKSVPGVSLAPFEGARLPLTSSEGQRMTVSLPPAFSTNNIFAALKAARKGLGYAVMPKWLVADEVDRGVLIDALPDWRAPPLMVTACYLPSRRQSRLLSAFVDRASEALPRLRGFQLITDEAGLSDDVSQIRVT
ncbi:MAG: LysR family transcriptional regulator [Henriciella sp.]|nr:LysR family transcriptional regulator [Henriciella sp.]